MSSTTGAVIVGFDGSPPSVAAATLGAQEALRRDVPLHLLHVFSAPATWALAPYVMDINAFMVSAEALVRSHADLLRRLHPDLDVNSRAIAGSPAGMLVEASRGAALLVTGCRGMGGFTELLIGSVSAQVVAHAHCPVMVCCPDGVPEADGDPRHEVLVGVDGSIENAAAIDFAFGEAALRGVPLVALYAWRVSPPLARDLIDLPQHTVDAAERESSRILDESLAGWSEKYPEVAVRQRLIHSLNPELTMIEASGGAALVVVGSHGHSPLGGFFLGSVSQALVHHARCPVVVVPTPRS